MNPDDAEIAQDEPRLQFAAQTGHGTKLGARLVLGLALLSVLPWPGPLNAQQDPPSFQPPVINGGNAPFDHGSMGSGDYVDSALRQKRLREIKEKQHKSIVADTAKLQAMVAELSAEISITKPVVLTPEQLRKVAKIEKLARNIREMMGILAR